MKGSIRRNPSSGTYYARLDVAPGPDGKRRQIHLKARTKRDLDLKIAETIAESERGQTPNAARVTVSELLDRWLATRANCAFRTIEGYRSQVELYLKPALGHILVSKLKCAHIQNAIDTWSQGPRLDGKNVVNPAYGTLSSACRSWLKAT